MVVVQLALGRVDGLDVSHIAPQPAIPPALGAVKGAVPADALGVPLAVERAVGHALADVLDAPDRVLEVVWGVVIIVLDVVGLVQENVLPHVQEAVKVDAMGVVDVVELVLIIAQLVLGVVLDIVIMHVRPLICQLSFLG